jgi:hypothetical protein
METFSLTAATVHRQLGQARSVPSGCTTTIYGGHEHTLRQTVIALTTGQSVPRRAREPR